MKRPSPSLRRLVLVFVAGLGLGGIQVYGEFQTYSISTSVPDVGNLRAILGEKVTISFEIDPEVRWDSKQANEEQSVENLGTRWYFGRSGKDRPMWPCTIKGSSGYQVNQDSEDLVAYSGYGMDGHDYCRMNNNFIDIVFRPNAETEVFIGWMGLGPTGLWGCRGGEVSVPEHWSLDLWAVNQVNFNVNGAGAVSTQISEEIPLADFQGVPSEEAYVSSDTEGAETGAAANPIVGLGF